MTLPKGHLSPSQINAWERCEVQYRIFTVEGNRAMPDFVLETKKLTHEVILERDLAYKIQHGANLSDSELSETYRSKMESDVLAVAREDRNLESSPENAVEAEIAYFDRIIDRTRPWRSEVKPKQVEATIATTIGGIPVEGRIDLIAADTFCDKIVDLKRQGSAPAKGSASSSRQLATYAIATGIPDVGLAAIVETKEPKIVSEDGQISSGTIARVTRQYQVVADQISEAIQKDRWLPVDISDSRKAWICSKKFCAAYPIGSRDWVTGRSIECPFGERSQTSFVVPSTNGRKT